MHWLNYVLSFSNKEDWYSDIKHIAGHTLLLFGSKYDHDILHTFVS